MLFVQGGNGCYTSNTGNVTGTALTDATTAPLSSFWAASAVPGANITIHGAGTSGADFQTTVSTYISNSSATLAGSAPTPVTNAQYLVGSGALLSSNWSTTIKLTLAAAQSAGDSICIGINNDPAQSVVSVTDSANNTYALRQTTAVGGADYTQTIYTATGIAASGAGANVITVTFSALSPEFQEVFFAHFSGLAGFGQSVGTTGTGTAVSSGNFGTAVTRGSVIFGTTGVNSHVSAAGAGYTAGFLSTSGDVFEYEIVGATGTFAVTATQASATTWSASGITLIPKLSDVLFADNNF